MRKKRILLAFCSSQHVLVKISPQYVGIFRFLLEGYDNYALFTVIDRYEALLRVFFSPDQEKEVLLALEGISETIELDVIL